MRHFIIVPLLLIILTPLRGQQDRSGIDPGFHPRFESFTLPGGVPGNSVQGIVQDSVGFVWFATQAGLLRYDGQNFTSYNFDPNNINTLSGDYIEFIFLDSRNTIWLTHWQQGGLTSFDPVLEIFTRYKNDPSDPESLSGGEISVVAEDRSGYIWVGGQSGLSRLDRNTGKFRHFRHDPSDSLSLSSDQVRALYVDRQGTLWIGTGFPWDTSDPEQKNGGLNRYEPATETFIRYMHDPEDIHSLANNKVRAILEDSRGNFWVGTAGDGLHRLDRSTGKFERLVYDPANPLKLSRPIRHGTKPSELASHSHVTCIFEDLEKRIWITAIDGGLNVYNPASGRVSHFEMGSGKDELTSNFLWHITQTRDGTVWITSGGEGMTLYKVTEQSQLFPFFEITIHPEESEYQGHGILKDHAGQVWLTQERPALLKRINRLTGKVDIIPLGDPAAPLELISSLYLDREGDLWISTDQGVFTGNPETARFEPFQPSPAPEGLLVNCLAPVLQTTSGQYWFASFDHGLFMVDKSTGAYINYRHDPSDQKSIGGNRVWGLFEDAGGNLWVGGGSPFRDQDNPIFLDRFNPKTLTFEHFLTGKQLSGLVFNITDDQAGNIWFTDFFEGFYKLNPLSGDVKKFTQFNSLLPPGQLHSMVKARDGMIWLNSEHHLTGFDPVTETMSVFTASHGLKSAIWFWGSGSAAHDGELLFARRGGLHGFYPDQLFMNYSSQLPDLRITGFRLLEGHITSGVPDQDQGILKKPIWQTSAIRLSHLQNVFSFAVACFDFSNPGANQLQFMLEGYDRGWRNDLRNGETPSYINIPPGEYTFRIRGANGLGFWNREGISLAVTILPPWWKTKWAYALYGVLILAGIFAIDRIQRKRIAEKERARSKDRELAQAQEIEKAYHALKATQSQLIHAEKMASLGELTAGIAHEIQNPLNFVNNFSEVSVDMIDELSEEMEKGNQAEINVLKNDLKQNLAKINEHGKRASSIVKGMLDHSRTNTGQKEPADINALADEYLRLAYHGLRAKEKGFNATIKTDYDETIGTINIIAQDIGRVLLNLFNNAFYAVNEKKKKQGNGYEPAVSLRTKRTNGRVELFVKDNGSGIPQIVLDKIFQPFFTTKPSGQGTGLGLSLSYDIIKGHGGDLKVETSEDEGAVFIISLPLS